MASVAIDIDGTSPQPRKCQFHVPKPRKCSVHVSNTSKCLLIVWAVTVCTVLAMTLPIGLCADKMFMEQDVGEIGVNGRLIHECNASLQLDVSGCYCSVCSKLGSCHKLKYELSLYDQKNNLTLDNVWVWGCHCSDYENPVVEGPMRCTIDENSMTLEGYGREASYKIMVITLVATFSAMVFCMCGIGGTIIGISACNT